MFRPTAEEVEEGLSITLQGIAVEKKYIELTDPTIQDLARLYEIDLSRDQDILMEDIQYLIDNSENEERTKDLQKVLDHVKKPLIENTPGPWAWQRFGK